MEKGANLIASNLIKESEKNTNFFEKLTLFYVLFNMPMTVLRHSFITRASATRGAKANEPFAFPTW
jgi:hypothetical protein